MRAIAVTPPSAWVRLSKAAAVSAAVSTVPDRAVRLSKYTVPPLSFSVTAKAL